MKFKVFAIALGLFSQPFQPLWALGIEYPQRVDFDNGYVLVHAPQVTAWDEFKTMKARAALEAYPSDGRAPFLATAIFRATTKADVDRRVVTVSELVVDDIVLANGSEAAPEKIRLLQDALPVAAREIPLDLVLSNLPEDVLAPDTKGIKVEPPTIYTATEPTLLLLTQGDPAAAPITDSDMFFVINTNWTLFTNEKKNKWWLLNGDKWLYSKALDRKWSYPRKLPKGLRNLSASSDQFSKAREAATDWKKPKTEPPTVISSSTPAELIVIEGDADIKPITEHLLYISNTTSHVFYHGSSFYFLVSGRWFSSPSLDGGWEHASKLPEAFLDIPVDHAKADVRASVPGTMEARMATLEASLPRQTVVDINSEVLVDVVYAGEPVFETIPGTSVARATNTSSDVLKVDSSYYVCYAAAWYTSSNPSGPWLVARSVPGAIYSIPPSSPSYHTTYVTVEESSNVHVSFGFTSGYYGSYVAFGVPVWGTGWYYPPYIYYNPYHPGYPHYPYYFPYPYSYGAAAFYNPRTGLYGATSRWYGPYGGYGRSATYNPRSGTYTAAESAWDNDEWAGQGVAYNPRTGRSFETQRYYDADDNEWKSSSTLEGQRGELEIERRRDEDGSVTRFDSSRGGSGEITTGRSDGGLDTRSEFQTADGRTISGQGRFENGEGIANLSGSDGGTGTIERSVDENGVTREGSFERDGKTLETNTTRDGNGARTTFEGSEGAKGVVGGDPLNKSFVAESANGDLYAGRNGNVYKRSEDGWQQNNNGSWESFDRRQSNSAQTNARASNRYDTSNLNRDYQARSQGMSQYRSRSSQYSSRSRSMGRMRRR